MTEPYRTLSRYAAAVVAVAVALGLKVFMRGLGSDQPFVLLAAAVIVAAWLGGRGPGLLAALLVALGADVLFLPPSGLGVNDFLGYLALIIEAAVVVEITARMRAAELRARREASESEIARRELSLSLRMREELLAFWSEKLEGPLTELVTGIRTARTALEQGNEARALVALDSLVAEMQAVQRTAEQWADRGKSTNN